MHMSIVKRIVIEGKTENDIHGTNLRETIEELGNSLGLRGFARNVKGKNIVEVFFEDDEKNKAETFYDELCKLKARKDKVFQISNIKKPSEQLFDLDNFRIEREDDLTEMVWALQGAGRSFIFSEKMREEQRKKSLLISLRHELYSISSHIGDIKTDIKLSDVCLEFRVFCIENFLKEPPNDTDPTLLSNLNDLYDICLQTNYFLRNPSPINKQNERIEENLKKIEELINAIMPNIKDKH